MAKIKMQDRLALEAGYAESERCQRAYGRAQYVNPHPWGSALHKAFEFGYYIQEKGLTLGAVDYWARGRGGSFVSPAGATFRVYYTKSAMGIQRLS
jgi:hypothetical protein